MYNLAFFFHHIRGWVFFGMTFLFGAIGDSLLMTMYNSFINQPLENFANNYTAYFLLVPETIALTTAVLILILDLIKPNRDSLKAPVIAMVGSLLSLSTVYYTQYLTSRYFNPALGQYWGGLETIDPFSLFLKSIAFWGVIFAIIMSVKTKLPRKHAGEYYALLMFATVAMTFVVSSSDILAIWVMTEFVSLTSYIIVAYNKHEPRAVEGGLKYLLLGAISSAFMLYGFSILYGITGTTNLYVMKTILVQSSKEIANPIFVLAISMFMVGIGFKLAIAPFHTWAPDAFEGASIPVASFIAVTPKIAVIAVFLRVFLLGLSNVATIWVPMMIGCSILSMVIGNLFAMRQNNIKRFLAYSGVAQMGFVLMGLCAAGMQSQVDPNSAIKSLGYNSILNYIVIYAIMTTGAFLIANIVEHHTGSEDYRAYRGLFQRAPASALTLMICLLSLAGIPLTGGFSAKFFVFAAAVAREMWFLVIVASLMAVLAAYYYLRWVFVMFLVEPEDRTLILPTSLHRWAMAVPFILLTFTYVPIPFYGMTLAQIIYDYASGSYFLTINVYFGA
jgi:NADH-quinone oxidoreductase subunit N